MICLFYLHVVTSPCRVVYHMRYTMSHTLLFCVSWYVWRGTWLRACLTDVQACECGQVTIFLNLRVAELWVGSHMAGFTGCVLHCTAPWGWSICVYYTEDMEQWLVAIKSSQPLTRLRSRLEWCLMWPSVDMIRWMPLIDLCSGPMGSMWCIADLYWKSCGCICL